MKQKLKKTILYRVFTLSGSTLIALIITGNLQFSLWYTILWEIILNTIMYYSFETVWNRKIGEKQQ